MDPSPIAPPPPFRSPDPPPAPPARGPRLTLALGGVSIALIPLNFLVWVNTSNSANNGLPTPFVALALLQFATGFGATITGAVYARRHRGSGSGRAIAIAMAVLGALVGLGGPAGIFLAAFATALGSMGGAWGRPLRLRGKILHPSLRAGSDWTRGERPRVDGLDAATRRALEALWLHDAQKEHASVPAFARISWLLAAVGAPAELMEGAHQAALEEIDHARRCFALAAGYGGRSHSVEPMPDLLVGGMDLGGDPIERLAVESLKDGCLLEDFNADVAAECERACEDAAARGVLGRIAREERSHAEFSWALLAWALERGGARVRRAVAHAMGELGAVARPTAVSAEKAPLVAAADGALLRAHGRLPDEAWAALYATRLAETERRVRALLAGAARTTTDARAA